MHNNASAAPAGMMPRLTHKARFWVGGTQSLQPTPITLEPLACSLAYPRGLSALAFVAAASMRPSPTLLRGWFACSRSLRTCSTAIGKHLSSPVQPLHFGNLRTWPLAPSQMVTAWPSTPSLLQSSLSFSPSYPHWRMHFMFSRGSALLPLRADRRHIYWSSARLSSTGSLS